MHNIPKKTSLFIMDAKKICLRLLAPFLVVQRPFNRKRLVFRQVQPVLANSFAKIRFFFDITSISTKNKYLFRIMV